MIGAARRLILAGAFSGLAAAGAQAGPSVCWIQNGVLLVPAVAAGVNGVFILDTGAARSELDATQASEADIGDAVVTAAVRVAGRGFPALSMQVVALDDRTRAFPTPISGVLGADILAGQVLTVTPSPCRLTLTPSKPGHGRESPVTVRDGLPFVRAAASDGTHSLAGDFRIDTGSPAGATIAGGSIAMPKQRLRALSFGGRLFEDTSAVARLDDAGGALGTIGEPIWSQFTLRLDFGRRTLVLTPVPGPKARQAP